MLYTHSLPTHLLTDMAASSAGTLAEFLFSVPLVFNTLESKLLGHVAEGLLAFEEASNYIPRRVYN